MWDGLAPIQVQAGLTLAFIVIVVLLELGHQEPSTAGTRAPRVIKRH
jgi:hypothetical protein